MPVFPHCQNSQTLTLLLSSRATRSFVNLPLLSPHPFLPFTTGSCHLGRCGRHASQRPRWQFPPATEDLWLNGGNQDRSEGAPSYTDWQRAQVPQPGFEKVSGSGVCLSLLLLPCCSAFFFFHVLLSAVLKVCFWCLCIMYVCLVWFVLRDWFCGLTWERVYIWEEFWNVNLLMTEIDCPEVTQCGWQGIKIQLLSNLLKSALLRSVLGREDGCLKEGKNFQHVKG